MHSEYSIEIGRPASAVFAFVEDYEQLPTWMPSLESSEVVQRSEEGVGTAFRQVHHLANRRVLMDGRITAYDPPRLLRMQLENDKLSLDIEFRFEEENGRTRLTQISEAKFHSLKYRLAAPLMREVAVHEMKKGFARLKELVENDG